MMYVGTALRYTFAAFGFALSYEFGRRGLNDYTNRNIQTLKGQIEINEKAVNKAKEILDKMPETEQAHHQGDYDDLVNNKFSKVHYGFNKEISVDEARKILKQQESNKEFLKTLPKILPIWSEKQ